MQLKPLIPIILFPLVVISLLAFGWWQLSPVWGGSLDVFSRWGWNAMRNSNSNSATPPIGLGWVSMNCLNDFDNDGISDNRCKSSDGSTNIPYGLSINLNGNHASSTLGALDGSSDTVEGCAWSDKFGWVCFNSTPPGGYCPVSGVGAPPACSKLSDKGVKIVKHPTEPIYYLGSSANANASSDARAAILNLAETGKESRGYIGFPFDNNSGKSPGPTGWNLSGRVMNCIGCTTATYGSGGAHCDACILTNDGYSEPTSAPNPNYLCTGCNNCITYNRGGSCVGNNKLENTCDVNSCSQCFKQPGTIVNYYASCDSDGAFCISNGNCVSGGKCNYKRSKAELCGWAYNGYQEGSTKVTGLGWIAWNPAIYGQASAYAQAQYGNVYSEHNITSYLAPPPGKFNSAYLIDAGGTITRWVSSKTADDFVRPRITDPPRFLAYDTTTGLATSTLGNIDIVGLITKVSGDVNRFGSTVNVVSGNSLAGEFGPALNDAVKVVDSPSSPVTLNAPVTVRAGSGGLSGAGIVYINGDLIINKNISYDTASVSRLKHIPSLVWIIRGDVTIDPKVATVAGTFIVLGKINAPVCPAVFDPINPPPSNSCGRFSTGYDKTTPTQLTVAGNVLARQFNLQRIYQFSNEPAEKFSADGRLQANPPSGLIDLSKTLPRFSFGF